MRLHHRARLTALLVLAACGGDGGGITTPTTGSLEVTIGTSGGSPTGYTVSLDGAAENPAPANGSVTLPGLEPGSHLVQLGGLPEGCIVEGANPRQVSVSAGSVSTVTFAVVCTPGPARTGTLSITTTTTGTDPDGYQVSVDGGAAQPIATNGILTLLDIPVGTHVVQLSGLAATCSVTGANPQTVTLEEGATVTVPFAVDCVAPPPPTGRLRIVTTTNGRDRDPDGYAVTVDGGSPRPIGIRASVTIDQLAPGTHTVALTGIAANCTVSGENPVTATVNSGGITEVQFAITCRPTTGALQVTTSTTGSDPNGYRLVLDGADEGAIGLNDERVFSAITPGQYTLALAGVASNCVVSGANPRTVVISAGETTTASFQVTCSSPQTGSIEVTTRTEIGSDPDGYRVLIDEVAPGRAITDNGALTIGAVPVGDHTVTLRGLAANCSVTGPNPVSLIVFSGQTAAVLFIVSCP